MRRLQRAPRGGYTVVEVMMALAVLTLSISGVLAMQKATGVANTAARNLATANMIAQSWMERMRVDALAWNEQAGTADISQTQWLSGAPSSPETSSWVAPTPNNFTAGQPAGAAQHDVTGADVYDGTDPFPVGFCTQVRLSRFATNAGAQFRNAIRVEVRVAWDRAGQAIDCTALPSGWDTNTAVNGKKQYGVVYLVSAVTLNAAPF